MARLEVREEILRIMDLPPEERQEALDRWAWRRVAQMNHQLPIAEHRRWTDGEERT